MTEHALTEQVTNLVRKLFWRQKSVSTAKTPRNVPPAAPQDLLPSQLPGPIVASRLQLIGLGRVRTVLGDRWSKLADRVRGIAQSIIEKNLLPGDVYEAQGDDGFLVLFPQLSPEDAHFKSKAICRQIEQRLIGCNLTDVSACTFEVFTVEPGQLLAAVADVGSAGGQSAQSGISATSESPKEPLSKPEAASANPPKGAAMTLVPDRVVGEVPQHPAGPAASAQNISESADDISDASGSPQPGDEAANDQWVYRPVWDFQRSTLMTFALVPFRLNTTAIAREAVPAGSVDEEFLSKLDNAALSKAVSDLEELSNSGRRLPILVQIHYATTISARRRALFLAKIKSIPAERCKLICFEAVDCPPDALTLGFTGFITAMRGCGVRMAMRVHEDWRDFRGIERTGIKLVTMDASDSPISEARRIAAFEKFADRSGNARLESGIWGLGTRSMVVGAAAAGIRHLAGRAIAEEVPNISRALRYSPVDLYLHH